MSDLAVDGHARLTVAPERMLGRAGVHRRPLEVLLAVAIYFGFACYFTWPLITHLSHSFYGTAGDPLGTMAFYRELVVHHHNPFLPGTITQLDAPEGQPIPWTRDLASMPGILTLYLLTAVFGSVPAYGLYALMGYTLTGLATFLLVRRLTRNTWAALIAGWAFAFYPYAIINGQGHDDNIQGWVLLLGLWRMLELMKVPSRRNALLAGAAVVFGMWWTPYFILLGGVMYAAAAVASLVVSWRRGRLREALVPQAITAAIVLVFLGFLVVLATTGPQGNSIGLRQNNAQGFNTYSARPLEYLLPDAHSPLFGSDTAHYLSTHIHGSNPSEATLYLGITIMLLALLGCWAAWRRGLPGGVRAAVWLLALVVLAALITSAPPQVRVFGLLIPFPSHFISKATSTWRVYARFVIVVMLGLSVLAGVGLSALAQGRKRWVRVAIMLIASVAVPLDLWARLPARTSTTVAPAVYEALAREPPGLVASYPLTGVGQNLYEEVFFRDALNKPMINGYLEGTVEEKRALSLANLSNPRTAPRLAALGVRYVILESRHPSYGLPSAGTPGRGFHLLYRESFGDAYAVTARPTGPALPFAAEGFGVTKQARSGIFNWLEEPSGSIELAGTCGHCRGVLRMTVKSFHKPRLLVISTAAGKVLLRRLVARPTELAVPLAFAHSTDLRVAASPGPQSLIKKVRGAHAGRLSVQIGDLEFTRLPRAARAPRS